MYQSTEYHMYHTSSSFVRHHLVRLQFLSDVLDGTLPAVIVLPGCEGKGVLMSQVIMHTSRGNSSGESAVSGITAAIDQVCDGCAHFLAVKPL